MSLPVNTLALVECGHAYAAQVSAGAYAGPARRLPAALPPARYLGLSRGGVVGCIGQVWGVVDLDLHTDEATVVSHHAPGPGRAEEALIREARQRLRLLVQPVLTVQRVVVLQALHPTSFQLPADGQLPLYLPVQAESARELARELAGKSWGSFCG